MTDRTFQSLVCSFCGKHRDEVEKLIVGVGVDRKGDRYEGRVCGECIATFMLVMATSDREWFDKQVEEARAAKP